ncbi:hypothetical protein [Streptomyces sp. SBT349]|uniref:hypothetical protein n=1 Tax=Streptomyces sp. SBT349 TaxID=1580539 RepID=UPI000A57EA10|nr:hypothetical protein [Streptomyces sp. SBT349]
MLANPRLVPVCIDCRERIRDARPVPVAVHPKGLILTVGPDCLITGRWIPLAQRPPLGSGEPLNYPPEPHMPEHLIRRLAHLGPRPDLRPQIERVVSAWALTALNWLLTADEMAHAHRELQEAVAELRARTRGRLQAVPDGGDPACRDSA